MTDDEQLRAKYGIIIPPGKRRPAFLQRDIDAIRAMRLDGHPIRTVADALRCSTKDVQRYMK